MRTLVHITLLMLIATSALANQDRIERPQTVAISFKTGERATFIVSNSILMAITLRVGSADYTVPATECAKLHDIRLESVAFLWNGSYRSAAEADYFYLSFDMGTESTRAFGELPQVSLIFRNGKFDEITLRKKVRQDTWQHSKL